MIRENIFDNPEMKSTRQAYGDALLELGDKNKDVVVLCADLTGSTNTKNFRDKFPDRFFEIGISEQDMMGIGAGLSFTGKVPFVSTFAVFASARANGQLRTSVCYNKANVKIGATHAGITVGKDGATHQALEDIATVRVLPNISVVVPCDYEEAKKAVYGAVWNHGPVYLRFGRPNIPMITTEDAPFQIGNAEVFREGTDITVIACGIMVYEALRAAEEFVKENISVRVINCHTIKPIDKEAIIKAAQETGAIVTAEEHQIDGGLGSAVAEVLAENHPVPMKRVGVLDTFAESGSGDELKEKYGLTFGRIMETVREVIGRKD